MTSPRSKFDRDIEFGHYPSGNIKCINWFTLDEDYVKQRHRVDGPAVKNFYDHGQVSSVLWFEYGEFKRAIFFDEDGCKTHDCDWSEDS